MVVGLSASTCPKCVRPVCSPLLVCGFCSCSPVGLLQNRFRASGPKWEKNRKNIGFGLPRPSPGKKEKNSRKIGKIGKIRPFSYFSAIFSYFPRVGPREAETYIFPIFSYFGPEAQNLFCSRPTGLQFCSAYLTNQTFSDSTLVILWFVHQTCNFNYSTPLTNNSCNCDGMSCNGM